MMKNDLSLFLTFFVEGEGGSIQYGSCIETAQNSREYSMELSWYTGYVTIIILELWSNVANVCAICSVLTTFVASTVTVLFHTTFFIVPTVVLTEVCIIIINNMYQSKPVSMFG